MAIRVVLFDMDGTIYDSGIDWLALRSQIGIPRDGRPILEQLSECDEETRARGRAALHRAEAEGAEGGRLIDGTRELLTLLRARGIRSVLVTNNSRHSADIVLGRHDLGFDLVLTREDGAAKPRPDLFRAALAHMSVDAADALVIGDTHLDLLAADAAGIREVILVASPAWVKEHIPEGLAYREAVDLHTVRTMVATLLDDAAA